MKIGKYVHPKTETLTCHYETACNYTKHEVQAGAAAEIEFDGYWFFVRLPAVQVEAYFVSRLFWASSCDHNFDRKPSVYGFQWDSYGLATAVHAGKVILADGWHVVQCGEYSDGRPMFRAERQVA
jgi:hypothetical protein